MKIFLTHALLLGLLAACSAPACGAVVTLSFTGVYQTLGGALFGITGREIPYNYQIIYDTSLDTSTAYLPKGAEVGSDRTTTHEWHGYSGSGIIGTNLTLGTKTWTAADLMDSSPGTDADFWLDTEISAAAPRRSALIFRTFVPGKGWDTLVLGGGAAYNMGDDHLDMIRTSNVMGTAPEYGSAFSSRMEIGSAPEPASALLAALGLGGTFGRRIRRC